MDNVIGQILIHTFHPDPALRDLAESNLKSFLGSPGAFVALLQFVSNQNISHDLRLSACIVIKNRSRDFWRSDGESTLHISEEDKVVAKDLLLNILLCETDNKARGMLAETIRVIAEFDFPSK
jgi:hypothetical protein